MSLSYKNAHRTIWAVLKQQYFFKCFREHGFKQHCLEPDEPISTKTRRNSQVVSAVYWVLVFIYGFFERTKNVTIEARQILTSWRCKTPTTELI